MNGFMDKQAPAWALTVLIWVCVVAMVAGVIVGMGFVLGWWP